MTDSTELSKKWPEDGEKHDLTTDKVFPMGWGLVYRAVCAPKGLTDQEISDIVSYNDPPGTSHNRWEVVDNEDSMKLSKWAEKYGNSPRVQCPDCEGREHVLMCC